MYLRGIRKRRGGELPRHLLRDRQLRTTACPACPTNQPRKDPFHMYFWVPNPPICLSFNSQQGPPCLSIPKHLLRDRLLGTTACPSCWGMGTNKVKYCTMKKKIFCVGRLEQPRQDKNLLYDEPNEPANEGSLCYVLLESPFCFSFNSWHGPPISTVVSLVNSNVEQENFTSKDDNVFCCHWNGLHHWSLCN